MWAPDVAALPPAASCAKAIEPERSKAVVPIASIDFEIFIETFSCETRQPVEAGLVATHGRDETGASVGLAATAIISGYDFDRWSNRGCRANDHRTKTS
ncbi:hypothetical protein [Beijerinckia sp. L45]|uniref:hypothetical protein n=1 Tax=Beijerinckia sp. L45 TaxID=1641855 RepID=UPI00131B748D|nr:hypothetical protein [Beijerinckia sp. L45]